MRLPKRIFFSDELVVTIIFIFQRGARGVDWITYVTLAATAIPQVML